MHKKKIKLQQSIPNCCDDDGPFLSPWETFEDKPGHSTGSFNQRTKDNVIFKKLICNVEEVPTNIEEVF